MAVALHRLAQECQWLYHPSRVCFPCVLDYFARQTGGTDCGVFACAYASYAANDLLFDFSQEDMPNMRKRIALSLLEQRLE